MCFFLPVTKKTAPKKTTARKPRAPRKPKRPPAEVAREAVVLHMVGGGEVDAAAAVAEAAGVDPEEAPALVKAARAEIKVAAEADRPALVRAELKKLDDIETGIGGTWNASAAAAKLKIVEARCKLLGLYDAEGEAAPAGVDHSAEVEELRAELAKVRGHLLGCRLAGADVPLNEHARIAAQRIMLPPPPRAERVAA